MLDKVNRIHFIGVGGYGMSVLAMSLAQKGYEITGSDLSTSSRTEKLESMGVQVYNSHEAKNVGLAELVIYSTAIPKENPELEYAQEQKIPLWHRSELLAEFINSKYGIAVAGAHGKTTTTAMLSHILGEAGLDPASFVGGELTSEAGITMLGNSEYVVAEACESDNSFIRYHPKIAIITNIEADHLEHYEGNFTKLLDTYKKFISNLKNDGSLILCNDDQHVREVANSHKSKIVTFGINEKSDIMATELSSRKGCFTFTLLEEGDNLGRVTLSMPGKHNIYNALAAIATARQLGIEFNIIATSLAYFSGAKRRFQIIDENNGITVVDDYAHHPTEVKATLKAARDYSKGKVVVVFQPHRYSRLNYFFTDFAASFGDADVLILDEVYAAGEEPIKGVDSKNLADKVTKLEGIPVIVINDKEEMVKYILTQAQKGDIVMVMGAGDITNLAYLLKGRI